MVVVNSLNFEKGVEPHQESLYPCDTVALNTRLNLYPATNPNDHRRRPGSRLLEAKRERPYLERVQRETVAVQGLR
jgi:hypothetical protein